MPHTQGSLQPAPAAATRGITVRPPVLVAMTASEWEEVVRLMALIAPEVRPQTETAA